MADAIVIGDGPGGLSAALFLAKNGLEVIVFGQDRTAMHAALLKNYLGIPEIRGTEFQKIARKQVTDHGGNLHNERVVSAVAVPGGGGFEIKTEGGDSYTAKYLILSEGKGPKLADQLGMVLDPVSGIGVDLNGQTGIDNVYVVGRAARPGRSQAIISAGDGAAAAIDILSREKGEAFCDWDELPTES